VAPASGPTRGLPTSSSSRRSQSVSSCSRFVTTVLNQDTLIFLLALIPAVICHEVSHGVVALWCGDDTAKRGGSAHSQSASSTSIRSARSSCHWSSC